MVIRDIDLSDEHFGTWLICSAYVAYWQQELALTYASACDVPKTKVRDTVFFLNFFQALPTSVIREVTLLHPLAAVMLLPLVAALLCPLAAACLNRLFLGSGHCSSTACFSSTRENQWVTQQMEAWPPTTHTHTLG